MPARRRLLAAAVLAGTLGAAGGAPGVGPAAAAAPQRYIVVLKDGSDAGQVGPEHGRRFGAEVGHVYRSAVKGYAARIPAARLAQLRADPRVAYVEADGPASASSQTLPWGVNRIDADVSSTRAGNGSGSVGGVNAYVIDSGISRHPDLNVVAHGNWTGDGRNYDCNGHGTHVAGTLGAKDDGNHVVGAAPGVLLVGLKVLGCDGKGSMSNIIAAVDWVTAHGIRPAVVNMSLAGPALRALDDAVRRSVGAGFLYTVAAGNTGANACSSSPARAGAGVNNGIIAVAVTDTSNREPWWSDYGSCVDIWAPGTGIVSTSNSGGTATMSGSSMAAPHAAGAGVLHRSRSPAASPATAEAALRVNVLSPGTASKDGRPIRIVYAGRY